MKETSNQSPADGQMTCLQCGKTLDASHFALIKGRYRRHTCNHCRWVNVILPSKKRRILSDSEYRNAPINGDDYEDLF